MVEPEKIIKVLIVDDHPPFAQGLATLVGQQNDMKSVGVAGDAEQALMLVREAKGSRKNNLSFLSSTASQAAAICVAKQHPELVEKCFPG